MVRDTNLISQELERLASYRHYPGGNTPSALTLARTGFVYSGREFKVSCPLCGIEVEKFRQDENPLDEHRKQSPNCPLAARAVNGASSSSPPPSIDIISEDAVQSSPLLADVYKSVMRRRTDGQSQMLPSALPAETSVQLSPVRVDRQDPDYELLRWERCRLDTYHDWPVTANAVPEDLAREGLFYTGTGDRVRCAFCRNGLRSWQPGDIPREEHAKYFPNCPFVQNRDVGNVRIERESNSLPSSSGHRASPVDHPPPPPSQVTAGPNVSVNMFMNSFAVRAVIEMGFSADDVKKTVQQQLSETGELFPNAEALLEKLLSLGIGISEVTSGLESREELEPVEPGSSASVAQQRQPEATTTASSEQATVANSVGQENVVTKKRKTRKKKRGKASNGEITANVRPSADNSSGTTSPANILTTSAAAAAAAAAPETANFPEAERFREVLLDAEEQELMEENARLREARLCRVCMDKEISTVFLPCGHLICCDVCSPRVRDCPLCRTFIRGTVKTFLS